MLRLGSIGGAIERLDFRACLPEFSSGTREMLGTFTAGEELQ